MTRPASRRVGPPSASGSSESASARTAAISSRSGNAWEAASRESKSSPAHSSRDWALGGFDLEDLVLQLRAARRHDLDRLALLVTEDRLADRRLVRQLQLGGIRFGGPDERYSTCFASTSRRRDRRADSDDVLRDLPLPITRADASRSSSFTIRASSIACSFLAASYSAFSAMSPNSRATLIRSATSRRRLVERSSISRLSFRIALSREDDVLQDPPEKRKSRPTCAARGREW